MNSGKNDGSSQYQNVFEVKNLDRDGNPINVGDVVGFIARGWFLPRGQESYGTIEKIDARGGILIRVMESYRVFNSIGKVATKESHVYYTHHVYDPTLKSRRYLLKDSGYTLCLYKVPKE